MLTAAARERFVGGDNYVMTLAQRSLRQLCFRFLMMRRALGVVASSRPIYCQTIEVKKMIKSIRLIN